MNMKTHPNDVSNARILEELQKLHASDAEIRSVAVEALEAVHELGEAVHELSDHMDQRFDEVHRELATKATKDELAEVRSDVNKLKTNMVTKGYLDDKMADFHSDIIQHTRKEIEKVLR